MYIVVPRALNQKQMPLQVGGTVLHGVVAIDIVVQCRRTKIALGIDGVIVLPVGNWSYGSAGTKTVVMGQGIEGEGASPAPPPPAEAPGVKLWIRMQRLVEYRDLVAQLHRAEVMVGRLGKITAPASHAAVVHMEH